MQADSKKRYRLSTCPKVEDVEKYAAAFEEVYPGYGWRLVLLAFATGLRFSEVLALRQRLDQPEDRGGRRLLAAGPVQRLAGRGKLPKNGKTRLRSFGPSTPTSPRA